MLDADQRWALTLLAESGLSGGPEALPLAHGFTVDVVDGFGLATKHHETMSAGGRTIDYA